MNIWGFPAFFLRCVAGLAACLFRVVYCIGLTCKNSGWRQLILQFHRRHGDILILGVCSLGIYPIGYWTLKDKDLTWFDHETMENQPDAMGFFWPAIRYNWILSKHQGLNPNIQPFPSRNMVIYHGILPYPWTNPSGNHGQNQFGWPRKKASFFWAGDFGGFPSTQLWWLDQLWRIHWCQAFGKQRVGTGYLHEHRGLHIVTWCSDWMVWLSLAIFVYQQPTNLGIEAKQM